MQPPSASCWHRTLRCSSWATTRSPDQWCGVIPNSSCRNFAARRDGHRAPCTCGVDGQSLLARADPPAPVPEPILPPLAPGQVIRIGPTAGTGTPTRDYGIGPPYGGYISAGATPDELPGVYHPGDT